ncbi:MAG: NFACT RNA binding domain-containing protein [archaeon]|jgi:predicted ribosome quality control (RQC) complex YloA/Tae2 family protein
MEIELDLSKTIEENAAAYFDKAKEAKKRVSGHKRALLILEQKAKEKEIAAEKKASESALVKENKSRKKKWYEQFRWFFSSDNLLVVGGKDAQSNEQIVKNRMQKNDVYFHAEVFGAPHCFIQAPEKLSGREFVPPESTMLEAAEFAVTFSKAWEEKRPQADAYSVKPEQVSKSTKSGESMGTGAFMIYGERNWFKKTPLSCAIGFFTRDKILMCAPLSAVKKHCTFFIELKQGEVTKEQIAKQLKEIFQKKGHTFAIDEFVSVMPAGSFSLKI